MFSGRTRIYDNNSTLVVAQNKNIEGKTVGFFVGSSCDFLARLFYL